MIAVSVVVLCVLAAAGLSMVRQPTYSATASSFVSLAPSSATQSDPFGGSQFVLQRMQSYAELATSRQVLTGVIERLGFDQTVDQLAGEVTSTAPTGTVLLVIEVRSEDPVRAALIADAVAAEQAEVVQVMEAAGSPLNESPIHVTTVAHAVVPPVASPVERLLWYVGAGMGAGLFLVACGFLVRRSLTRSAVGRP